MDESSTLTNAPPERIRVTLADEQSSLDFDREALCAAVRTVLGETWHGLAIVSVAIVDDPTIHRLNQEFLGHDYATDVLSFILEQDEERLEGEIIASAQQAQEQGPQYGWSAADELLLYVVHGALHLAGYDDSSDLDAAEMRRQEAYFLDKLGCTGQPNTRREPTGDAGR